jgi:hypothetical protein
MRSKISSPHQVAKGGSRRFKRFTLAALQVLH